MWPPVPDIRAAVGVSGACRRLRLFWERTNSGPPKLPLRWSSLEKPDKELAAFPALVVTPLGQAWKYKSLGAPRVGHWQDSGDRALSWRCPGSHSVALGPPLFGSASPSPAKPGTSLSALLALGSGECLRWAAPAGWKGVCSVPGLCAVHASAIQPFYCGNQSASRCAKWSQRRKELARYLL